MVNGGTAVGSAPQTPSLKLEQISAQNTKTLNVLKHRVLNPFKYLENVVALLLKHYCPVISSAHTVLITIQFNEQLQCAGFNKLINVD